MTTVKVAVEEVSSLLNDQEPGNEFTRWPRRELVKYCDDACKQISLYRPDAFTTVDQINLVPGVRQKLPDGISSLASVLDNNDPDNPLAVMRDDIGLIRSFSKKACNYMLDCNGNPTYKMSSYSYDPRVPGYFFVSPPVPVGVIPPPSVGISGVNDPPDIDVTWWLKDIPISTKYYNAVIAFMLSKAYEVDTESETSFRALNYHRNEFYRMMGIKYQMESKFNSGWYLGQRGYESNVRGQN